MEIAVLLISHRGNITGPESENENKPEYLLKAIGMGYDVEVDVWYVDGQLYLGHDGPEYKTEIEFLQNDKFWCHCKNIQAVKVLLQNNVHCFFHKSDDITLTSKNYIWTFPKKRLLPGSVCVMPEYGYEGYLEDCVGICSDYVEEYKDL
jgi:hypothetical protein